MTSARACRPTVGTHRINDLTVGLLLVGANLGWHNPSGFMTPATACQPRLAPTREVRSAGGAQRRHLPQQRAERGQQAHADRQLHRQVAGGPAHPRQRRTGKRDRPENGGIHGGTAGGCHHRRAPPAATAQAVEHGDVQQLRHDERRA
ncbi:hypothetical protein G6F40_015652 [Rhizopus arrhizus]|nr:hypothetical protein G6F32_015344 [Rhizopus arrhizus]KAG1081027.1 hypothetical protein G6F40_015652 [Rhizopus arrhizus]